MADESLSDADILKRHNLASGASLSDSDVMAKHGLVNGPVGKQVAAAKKIDVGARTGGWPESVARGMLEPIEGAYQLGAHMVASDPFRWVTGMSPQMQAYAKKRAVDVDQFLATEQEKFSQAKANAGRTGFDYPELAGNLLSPANLIPIGKAAQIGSAARAAAPAAVRTIGGVVGNALKTAAQRGAIGAGVASLQPITGGDFWDEKTKQTAVGFGAGIVLPPVINGVLHGGGATVAPVVKWIAGIKGPNVVQNAAAQEIIRRMAQDSQAGGPTAQDMIDLLNAAPHKPLALVDVAGENTKALAGRLARQPGEARQLVIKSLDERDLDAGLRLSEDVNRSIGSGSSHSAAHALLDARAHAAAPLYTKAFAANQNIQSPMIDKILATPAGKAALSDARAKMQNDMTLMGKPDPELAEQAAEAGQKLPRGGAASGLKLRTLDYVKRSMDDMIGVAQRAGEKDKARVLVGLKSAFVSELDKADVTGMAGPNSLKPQGGLYAQARKAYSGPSQSLDALENGEKFLSKSPEEIADEISNLSPSDKQFYKLGAAAKLRSRINATGMGGDEAKKIIGNRNLQAQIRPLFDDNQSYDRFINSVVAENTMFETRFNTLKGSQTAARLGEDQSAESRAFGNAAHGAVHLLAGNHLTGLKRIGQAIGDLAHRPDPELAKEMANYLTQPLNAQNSAGMNLLQTFSRVAPRTQNLLSSVASKTANASAPVAGIVAQQIPNP